MQTVTYKKFLRLAIPFTLSTVTQPLLGAVDTAVVGRLDSPAFIGGVAIGTVIFNTLYWLFGFLRVATSGFAAQSLGSRQSGDIVYAWLRPLVIAMGIGVLFVACQHLIIRCAMGLYDPDPGVAGHAVSYFNILIWGAPQVLVGYVNLGWLMGRGHVREVLVLQVGTNVMNILLDILFVTGLHFGVKGVAAATLVSQSAGLLLGLYLVVRRLPLSRIRAHLKGVFEAGPMKKLAMVNSDLFVRTACLLTMTNLFIARGSSMGADILAANAILFQIQYLIAYLFDGLANAASVFSGRFAGAGDSEGFVKTRAIADVSMVCLGLVLVAGLVFLGHPFLRLFTDLEPVLAICRAYFFYLILFVIAMAPGLVYSGFYIGATCSAPIRNSLVLALAVFIPAELVLVPAFGNHGLWTAFICFCCMRSLVLFFAWSRMIDQNFSCAALKP